MPKLFAYLFTILCLITCTSAIASAPLVDIRIHPSSADVGAGSAWVVEISSVPDIRHMDGLLTPSTGAFSHEGYLFLWEVASMQPMVIPFEIDVPLFSDLNGNDKPDSFERRATFNLQVSRGTYLHPITGESVSLAAFWHRAANDTHGSIWLLLESFNLVLFHEFELLSFGSPDIPLTDGLLPSTDEYLLSGETDAAGSETSIIPGYSSDEVTSGPTKEISLAWDPNQETDLAGYYVYVVESGRKLRRIRTSAAQVAISRLEAGKTYALYVTAYNTSGIESAPSETISYTVPWITHLDRSRITF